MTITQEGGIVPPSAPKRVRKKPRRGVDKAIMSKRRKAFQGMEDRLSAREAKKKKSVEAILDRIRNKQPKKLVLPGIDLRKVVSRTIHNQATLLKVWGHPGIPTHVSFASTLNVVAYTDFNSITVRWPDTWVDVSRVGQTLVVSKSNAAHQVVIAKAIIQHEMGHIRFTRPLSVVLKECGWLKEYSWMNDGTNYVGGIPSKLIHHCWNILEDQRMESLVVEKVHHISNYFGYMLRDVVLKDAPPEVAWLYLAGRAYLPNSVLRRSFTYFDEAYGDGKALEWYNIVGEYRAASTSEELVRTVIKAAMFLERENIPTPINVPDVDIHKEPGAGARLPALSDGAREQGELSSNVSGGSVDDDDADADLDEFVGKAKQDAMESNEIKDASREANESGKRASNSLAEWKDGTPLDPDAQARARLAAIGIKEALNHYVTDSTPRWMTSQEVGVVDALRYRTRQPGSRAFRRTLIGNDESGLSVHVSMLADVSGSMSGKPVAALSEAMLAMAWACQELGIGNTNVLWSSRGYGPYKVWANGKIEPTLFPAMGGTEPSDALDDLANHNEEGADAHLVVIFTDGAWYNTPSLRMWEASDRTIVVVRYGRYDGEVQKDLGADGYANISDISQLPAELTKALNTVLGKE